MIIIPESIPSRSQWIRTDASSWCILAMAAAAAGLTISSSSSQILARQTLPLSSPVITPRFPTSLAQGGGISSYPRLPQTSLVHHQQFSVYRQQQQAPLILNSDSPSSSSSPFIIKWKQEISRQLDYPSPHDKHHDHLQAAQENINPRRRQGRHLAKRQQAQSDAATLTPNFPQPFDTSLGNEFDSDTCGTFIANFLRKPTFQQCHPFSLLLTTSQSFYQAGQALSTLPMGGGIDQSSSGKPIMPIRQVLDASCKANPDQCEVLFDQLSANLKSPHVGCGVDLEKQNSLAVQALSGLSNYRLMREVACLRTRESAVITPYNNTLLSSVQSPAQNSTNNTSLALVSNNVTERADKYCFENAMSSQTPDDLYYYYLPLGTSLPSGTQPICNECTRFIMRLYALALSKDDLALHQTYPSALTMTNSRCGPGFAPMPTRNAVSDGNAHLSNYQRSIHTLLLYVESLQNLPSNGMGTPT
ncbi:hypothetical protein PCANC_19710 [Puccinia coronata f. sp. avenae]|uniref:DUF7729 domain-containing protein n=1 Tax=Puccinia coronata f. sp. avenae TaxID=200324 RepID=A0A2N5STV1_9BASI|nr:hypothetical protein PCANC_19710 [Puccinia coronata f. sp. avenae]PLW16662.1 hypothetical protein PCASD_14560 [Puccinia coronata f. sp. avenae]